jgi:hydrogenase nickel incorporation protein HypB
VKLNVNIDLAAAGKEIARAVRQELTGAGVLALNLIGSPGCGKTSLLEATLPKLQQHFRVAVIEGDIATGRDAERIEATGTPCRLINTGGTCHLPPKLVAGAYEGLDTDELDLVIIENVGNLVCPSTQDVGEHAKVAVLSTPEGDDKVLKYPRLFREAGCAVLNKIDLADVLGFDRERVLADIAEIKSDLPVFELSARTGEGLQAWLDWVLNLYRQTFGGMPKA